MDFVKELGALALATRLKRISEVMIRDGHNLYKDLNLDIEPNWFLVLMLLQKNGLMSITEIADSLGFTHPTVNALVNNIVKKGYVLELKDKEDARRRLLKLSPKGISEIENLEKVWKAGKKGIKKLIKETGYDVMDVLEKLEDRLKVKGFNERTQIELNERAANRKS